MNLFFGKFSRKFPDQINLGFYRTSRPEMFGDLEPQDIVYAIGGGKIQLWRAVAYEEVEGDRQMNFEILIDNLNINTSKLVLFKFFKINLDLVIYPIRQAQKAFFQIQHFDNIGDVDILSLETYHNEENYRNITFLDNIEEIPDDLIDKDIFLYKVDTWKLLNVDFIEDSIVNKFIDNTSNYGKGRKNKDKILKKIIELNLPTTFTPQEFSFIDLYDVFFCKYGENEGLTDDLEILNIYPHKIFKLSQGKDFSEEEHKLLLTKNLVSVHKNTSSKGTSTIAQGEAYIQANIGDYFYLCKGNYYFELIGRFISEARPSEIEMFSDQNWYVREFETVAKAINKKSYKGEKKWWTPNDNSTFIEIPNTELNVANDKIFNHFFSTEIISSKADYKMKNIVKILQEKKQIILQGAPGTGKTYNTAEIALRIINETDIDFKNRILVKNEYQKAVDNGQIVFTTFHQSMDYEEFIEGIKPNIENGVINYEVQPGIFKKICKDAVQKDALKSLKEAIEKLKEDSDSSDEGLILKTIEGGEFSVTYRGGITFRVRSLKSKAKEGKDFPANIENIEKLYTGETKGIYNKSYVWGILEYIKNEYGIPDYQEDVDLKKNYVLIIDEINRGNISKIFGELITLLEADKRIGADNVITCRLPYSPNEEFGVPDNLYIIGTMNTTDRSLGHIDYAVRRRFAFVTLKSEEEKVIEHYSNDDLKSVAIKLYNEVISIVNNNVSPEFNVEDVKVGHSYFMAKDKTELELKLKYEIKPLLIEYVKDGILTLSTDDIQKHIETLSLS